MGRFINRATSEARHVINRATNEARHVINTAWNQYNSPGLRSAEQRLYRKSI